MDLDQPGPSQPMTLDAILTIGVYGWDAERFAAALLDARCDVLIDIRARRGVRGSEYAFANRGRLEAMAEGHQFAYASMPQLAPTQAIRDQQRGEDREARTAKRVRTGLARSFVEAYQAGVLARLDPTAVIAELASLGSRPAFLCVERTAEACHRGLAAQFVADAAGVKRVHLEP